MGGGHPWSLVTAGLEALLTARYVLIDDHVVLLAGAGRAGRRGCLMRSWCAWRWRRCCWAAAGASLAAVVLRAAGPPGPLPAASARLPQARQGRRAADLPGHVAPGY